MIVVMADDIPPAVRGRMKLWFIEIRPNVFVSGVKDAVAKSVVEYLLTNARDSSSMVIIESTRKAPYYKISKLGYELGNIGAISGLPLIFERISED